MFISKIKGLIAYTKFRLDEVSEKRTINIHTDSPSQENKEKTNP